MYTISAFTASYFERLQYYYQIYVQQQQQQQQQQPMDGIQGIFHMIDPDGDGIITADKLRKVSVEWDLGFTDEEIENMIKEADTTGRGFVRFNQLDRLMETSKVAMEAEERLFENIDDAFKYFDTGQNRIKSIDLSSALRMANVNPTPQDVRDLLRTLGYPRTINYQQFKRITQQASKKDHLRLVAAIQCFDPQNTGYLSPEKLREILQPTAGKTFTSFTKQDMENIIKKFTQNGRIDTEVFVHYLMGQENYLPVERRLPPTPERTSSSLLRLRKNSGSDFAVDNQVNKVEIQPKLNAAFKRKLRYYKQLKMKEEIERQKEAKRYRIHIQNRRKRLLQIPEEHAASRNEGKDSKNEDIHDYGAVDENDESENKDIESIFDNTNAPMTVLEPSDQGDDFNNNRKRKIKVVTPEDKEKQVHTERELKPEENNDKGRFRHSKQSSNTVQREKISNRTAKDGNRKTKLTQKTIADHKVAQVERNGTGKKNKEDTISERKSKENDGKVGQNAVDKTKKKGRPQDFKKQTNAEAKATGVRKEDGGSANDDKRKNESQTETEKDLHPEETSQKHETDNIQTSKSISKDKKKVVKEMREGVSSKIPIGYTERFLKTKEKQIASRDQNAKLMKSTETFDKQKNNESEEINTKKTYLKLMENKQKYKEEHRTDTKHRDNPENVRNYIDQPEQKTETKVKSYSELHVIEKRKNEMLLLSDVANTESVTTLQSKTAGGSLEEINESKINSKGYYDLHREEAKRRMEQRHEETYKKDIQENKPLVLANANDDRRVEQEDVTYTKLNENNRKYKAKETKIMPRNIELTDIDMIPSEDAPIDEQEEVTYSKLNENSRNYKAKETKIVPKNIEITDMVQSENAPIEGQEEVTYSKLNENSRKYKANESNKMLKIIESTDQTPLENTHVELFIKKEKGYAELHRVDERQRLIQKEVDRKEEKQKQQIQANELQLENQDVEAQEDSNTYAKLNEERRKYKMEHPEHIQERLRYREHDNDILNESIEVKPKGYCDIHQNDERLHHTVHFFESEERQRDKRNNSDDLDKIQEGKEVRGYAELHKTNAKHQQIKENELNQSPTEKGKDFRTFDADKTIGDIDKDKKIDQEKQTYLKLSEKSKKHYERTENDEILNNGLEKQYNEEQFPIAIFKTRPKSYAEIHHLEERWMENNLQNLIAKFNTETIEQEEISLADNNSKPTDQKKESEIKTYVRINEAAKKLKDVRMDQPVKDLSIKEHGGIKLQAALIPPKVKGYTDLRLADRRIHNLTKPLPSNHTDTGANNQIDPITASTNPKENKLTYAQMNESSRKYYEQQRKKIITIPARTPIDIQQETQTKPEKGYFGRYLDIEKQREMDMKTRHHQMSEIIPDNSDKDKRKNEPETKVTVKEKQTYLKLSETARKHIPDDHLTNSKSKIISHENPTENTEQNHLNVVKIKSYTDRHREEKQYLAQKAYSVKDPIHDNKQLQHKVEDLVRENTQDSPSQRRSLVQKGRTLGNRQNLIQQKAEGIIRENTQDSPSQRKSLLQKSRVQSNKQMQQTAEGIIRENTQDSPSQRKSLLLKDRVQRNKQMQHKTEGIIREMTQDSPNQRKALVVKDRAQDSKYYNQKVEGVLREKIEDSPTQRKFLGYADRQRYKNQVLSGVNKDTQKRDHSRSKKNITKFYNTDENMTDKRIESNPGLASKPGDTKDRYITKEKAVNSTVPKRLSGVLPTISM